MAKKQTQTTAPTLTNEQIEETAEKIMDTLTETDPDTGELVAKHYAKPAFDESNPLTAFDYTRLKGVKFEEYFAFVEGQVRDQKSHSMAVRSGGLNRNNSYFFDKYRGYPIKETINGHSKIVGIELISDKPKNVAMRLPLHAVVTLNAQIGSATSAYPCDIYLLNQTQTIIK